MKLCIDRSKVLYQLIDGEYVVVDLTTGTYYSLRQTAADIWSLVTQNLPLGQIVQALSDRYEVSASTLEDDVTTLLRELEREGLLASSSDLASEATKLPVLPPTDSSRVPYTSPLLEKFEDMQDLILLDPIHEVDEDKGWPHIKKSS